MGCSINQIIVVDSPMGTGKTSAMIQKMNLEPDKNYLFVTPYIDEIERIIAANTSGNFNLVHQPHLR